MSAVDEIKHAASACFPITSSFLVFDEALTIIHSQECSPTQHELLSLREAFGERDAAILKGVSLNGGRRFEIHRHHPPLVYGRQMIDVEPEEAPGIAACKIEKSIFGSPCYAVITYQLPNTSAKMASLLRDFCQRHIQAS